MLSMKTTAIALGALALVAFAAPAHADTYGVVDINKVVRTADPAKAIVSDLDGKRKAFQDQVVKQENSLRATEQDLMKQKDKLSKEDFEKKRKEFQDKVTATQKDVQEKKQALDKTFADAMGKLRGDVFKATADVAKAKGFTAVFNTEAFILADPKMDITDEVIAAINKKK